MSVNAYIAIIPSADLEKSLRFWVDGLDLTADQEMRREGRLIGCMVHNDRVYFWLNQRAEPPLAKEQEGIRLYWTPSDIRETRDRLKKMGYEVSEIEARDYGQTEFFATDEDGYSHCFGIATKP
jgi:catechol 2,3-dioxygenase-like lactoylglutathione lyase family enzyme